MYKRKAEEGFDEEEHQAKKHKKTADNNYDTPQTYFWQKGNLYDVIADAFNNGYLGTISQYAHFIQSLNQNELIRLIHNINQHFELDGFRGNVIWHAARLNMPNVVVAALQLGYNVESTDTATLDTPLHFAVRYNNPLLVLALTAAGANPESLNAKDISPSSEAQELGHINFSIHFRSGTGRISRLGLCYPE